MGDARFTDALADGRITMQGPVELTSRIYLSGLRVNTPYWRASAAAGDRQVWRATPPRRPGPRSEEACAHSSHFSGAARVVQQFFSLTPRCIALESPRKFSAP